MLNPEKKAVGHFKKRLTDLRVLLEHYVRYFALKVISERDLRRKSQTAEQLVQAFEALAKFQNWSIRQFHTSSHLVCWKKYCDPVASRTLRDGVLDYASLDAALGILCKSIGEIKDQLLVCWHDNEFAHLSLQLEKSLAAFPDFPNTQTQGLFLPGALLARADAIRLPTKAIVGPRESPLDNKKFLPTYSLQEYAAPRREDRFESIVPFFWTLSTREAMVCDSCLLSAVEYDGMPFQFYQDMAQQAADEARHAFMYFNLAKELMPIYLERVSSEHIATIYIRNFLHGRGRLPVPKEGNLFSCMWHATLEERLIIMQVETEGGAVAATRAAVDFSVASEFPNVKRALEVDYYDEVAHARIGTRWLRFLCPDANDRKTAITNARLLRGVLLLTCFDSDTSARSIGTLMDRCLALGQMPSQSFFELSALQSGADQQSNFAK